MNSDTVKDLTSIQEEAFSFGVPEFSKSYLKEESLQKFETLNDQEKEEMIVQWYNIQIPHYKTSHLKQEIAKLQAEAASLKIPPFSPSFLKPETQQAYSTSNEVGQLEITVKWYKVCIDLNRNKMQVQQPQQQYGLPLSAQSLKIREEASRVGVPPFDASYTKPETQAKYATMTPQERIELEDKWYSLQTVHYKSINLGAGYPEQQKTNMQSAAVGYPNNPNSMPTGPYAFQRNYYF